MSVDLRQHASDSLDDRLVDPIGPTSKELFSAWNPPAGPFAWNPDRWTAGLDFTGVSYWNDLGVGNQGGTLITPRHIVWARHYWITVGTTVIFIRADGSVVSRTVVEYGTTPFLQSQDVMLGALDSDVPADVPHYPVLPANYTDFLSIEQDPGGSYEWLPLLQMDQERKAIVTNSWVVRLPPNPYRLLLSSPPALGTLRRDYYEQLVVGDSGKPTFLLFGDQPVLIGCHWASNADPFLTLMMSEVNAELASMLDGTGYQLTEFDIQGYIDGLEESSASSGSSQSLSSGSSRSSSSPSSQSSLSGVSSDSSGSSHSSSSLSSSQSLLVESYASMMLLGVSVGRR